MVQNVASQNKVFRAGRRAGICRRHDANGGLHNHVPLVTALLDDLCDDVEITT